MKRLILANIVAGIVGFLWQTGKDGLGMKAFFSWLKARRLRKTQEEFAAAKARLAAIERLGHWHCAYEYRDFTNTSAKIGRLEERVEQLMRQ